MVEFRHGSDPLIAAMNIARDGEDYDKENVLRFDQNNTAMYVAGLLLISFSATSLATIYCLFKRKSISRFLASLDLRLSRGNRIQIRQTNSTAHPHGLMLQDFKAI